MAKILSKGNGYQILYKERGEDSEKIAPAITSFIEGIAKDEYGVNDLKVQDVEISDGKIV